MPRPGKKSSRIYPVYINSKLFPDSFSFDLNRLIKFNIFSFEEYNLKIIRLNYLDYYQKVWYY
jgi:hypothetical protein